MPESNYNSKRVAKNTLVLYVRMFFMMLISLYTSRVVLNTLGVEDFGVYQVVGGFVTMFSILSTSLANAISRYITFSLGKGDLEESRRVYSTAIMIQAGLALIIGIIIEIIGVWFLYNKMVIPEGRLHAAFWVMQCSIAGFCIGLLSVPYNAEIVAHEKMDIYAYFSLLDALLKLGTVYCLYVSPFDKLISYAVLVLITAILMRIIYALYCKRHFAECDFEFEIDHSLLKEIGSFAGWNFLGEGVWILSTQGINILINTFFGVTLNAARGVAEQINGAIGKLSGNFTTALTPQITKTFASKELDAMHSLINRGTKLSYILMLLMALPIYIEMPYILRLWLKNVPDYAVTFSRLSIISSLIIVIGSNLVKAQLATGDIKRYQIIISLCGIWTLPLTWLAFKFGCSPEWSYHIFNVLWFIIIFVRIYLVKDLIKLDWRFFCKDVLGRMILVTIFSTLFTSPILVLRESFWRLLLTFVSTTVAIGILTILIGCNREERDKLVAYCRKGFARLKSY